MWKNFCACSTTLASLWSGTPTPPRFSSMRMRNRAMSVASGRSAGCFARLASSCFDQRVEYLAVDTILDDAGFFDSILFGSRLHQRGLQFPRAEKMGGCILIVPALYGHQRKPFECRARSRIEIQQASGILLDTFQIEHLHAHGHQVRKRFLSSGIERQQALIIGFGFVKSPQLLQSHGAAKQGAPPRAV